MKIRIHHHSFEVDPDPYPELWQHIGSGQWEAETFEVLDHYLSADSIMIDIGCWEGPVTFYAARIARQVIAIDPDPVAFERFEKNCSLNPDLRHKITGRQLAIARKNGSFPLYARSAYGTSSSSLLHRIRDTNDKASVNAVTLDQLIETEKISGVDFIKMDIEGGEFQLLPFLAGSLEKLGHPTIYISFHYEQLKEHFYREKIKGRFLSLLMMKLEKWFGVELFRKNCRREIKKALEGLSAYTYVYNDKGQRLELSSLHLQPVMAKNASLVFSSRAWK